MADNLGSALGDKFLQSFRALDAAEPVAKEPEYTHKEREKIYIFQYARCLGLWGEDRFNDLRISHPHCRVNALQLYQLLLLGMRKETFSPSKNPKLCGLAVSRSGTTPKI